MTVDLRNLPGSEVTVLSTDQDPLWVASASSQVYGSLYTVGDVLGINANRLNGYGAQSFGSVLFCFFGNSTSGFNLQFEGTIDGFNNGSEPGVSNYFTVVAYPLWGAPAVVQTGVLPNNFVGAYRVDCAGLLAVRVKCLAKTTGQLQVAMQASPYAFQPGRPDLMAGIINHANDITVDATAGGVTLRAANSARKSLLVQNVGTANMRVSYDGTAPTSTRGVQVTPGAGLSLEMPYCPQGIVKAIREGTSSTSATVTEIMS